MNKSEILSKQILEDLEFKLVKEEDNPFEHIKMPYYVKNCVVLFFNEGEFNENSFLIGYAEMRWGVYYAVTFMWISSKEKLFEIFKAVTGSEL